MEVSESDPFQPSRAPKKAGFRILCFAQIFLVLGSAAEPSAACPQAGEAGRLLSPKDRAENRLVKKTKYMTKPQKVITSFFGKETDGLSLGSFLLGSLRFS